MIAIRLLHEGAVVREAVFLLDRPLVVGRGPEADFPLTDPSVSRTHARILRDEAGAVWIEDVGGRNGLLVGDHPVERAAIEPAAPLVCHLGAAVLEVALASADATLEWRRPERGQRRGLRTVAFWAAGVGALLASAIVQPSFWSPWEKNRLTNASWTGIGAAVALPVLGFLLVGVLRIVGRRVRLAETLRALAVVGAGWGLVQLVEIALPYLTGVAVHRVCEALLRIAALGLTVAYLASVGRAGPRRRFFLAWCAAAGVLAVAFYLVGSMAARQTGVPDVRYDASVPVLSFAGPASELDPYLEKVRGSFASAQEEAEEERIRAEAAP